MSSMGTFRTTIQIESAEHRRRLVAMAPDYVVFAEPGDKILLGARSLEGLNLRVDAQRKQLIPAGPMLARVAA